MTEIQWALTRASSLPAGDDWLGPQERAVQAALRFPKRKAEWRLGRYTAKRLLSRLVDARPIHRIQIIAAEDGAPEAFVDGHPVDVALSITHRADLAACALVRGSGIGCDLEVIESRTSRFVEDYFTAEEKRAVQKVEALLRDRYVALVWSAKESALKVLRVGLRHDTRDVAIQIEQPGAKGTGWSPLGATMSREGRCFEGWWRQLGNHVLTVACDNPALRIARHDEER